MKRVEIREACFEDLNEINRLVERVFDQFVAPGYSDEGVESFLRYIDLDLIRARFNQNHIIYIAENLDTKHIIGMLEVKIIIMYPCFVDKHIWTECWTHVNSCCF